MRKSVDFGGVTRTYLVHVPAALAKPAALVVVLHGGGGSGLQMERHTGFSAISDKEGFLVAYPDGAGGNWYDGREGDFSAAHRERRNDAGFIGAMIDAISKEHAVDPKRIYATGISNGGFFSNYLASKLNGRFAAVAPVAGGIGVPFHNEFRFDRPTSALVIQGTDDPLVPYQGGNVALGRGKCIPAEEAIRLWVKQNGCRGDAVETLLPDVDPTDQVRARRLIYTGGRDGVEVVFLKLERGGHTWPSGTQYLPKVLVGRVCRDIDSSFIWEFFKAHPRR